MKKIAFILVVLLSISSLKAQESSTVFNFLKLSSSAHSAALGGSNISLIQDDATLIFHNPALLSSVSDRTLNLNFMTYMQGSKVGSAAFTKTFGERSTWAATAQFVHYGSMKQTTAQDVQTGSFSALDMAINGVYSYNLSDLWAGGVTGKFIYSKYGDYSSIALGVDLGLNYYDEDKDFSASIVAANLGGQIKAFGDTHEKLPFDLQIGFTKGMSHAPFAFSLTLIDLTHWSSDYYYSPNKKANFGRILTNHIVAGVDWIPSKYFYLSAGYNFRRAYELKAAGSSHGAGLTFGGGLTLSRFKLGVAYAKYHVSTSSLVFNASYRL
ncbi:MAG: type IX secretion system protein PorQ [Paraprevotella sp.]|nr:type IX secretion system protein PorQ [Paraprevotella sp.]